MNDLGQQIQKLLEEMEALRKENNFLRERVAELEKRLNLNSSNSSKPPSSDGFKKTSTKKPAPSWKKPKRW